MRPRVPRVCTTGALGGSRRAARAVDEVMRVLELFEDALPGLHGQALPREAGLRAWLRAELQLASPELAGARQDQAGAQTRGAPPGSGRADRWWG